jgi:haloalkane dehalogenase
MRDIDRPRWLRSDEYPFVDRYITIDRCRVHYVADGSGPAILMLAGNPFWSFAYRHLIINLRDLVSLHGA